MKVRVCQDRVTEPACAARGPVGGLGHIGLQARFANKTDPRQQVGHEGLAPGDPDVTGGGDLRPLPPGGAQVFFVCQPEVAQEPPDRTAMHPGAVRRGDPHGKSGGCQVARPGNPSGDPVLQRRPLAAPAAVALRLRSAAPGRRLQLAPSVTHRIDPPNRVALARGVFAFAR